MPVTIASLMVPVLLGTMASSGSAGADKGPPQVRRVGPAPIGTIWVGGLRPETPLCQIGEVTTGSDVVNYIDPPGDVYYTLLRASACPACVAPDTLVIKSAHLVLHFPVQCVVQVEISIVGTRGGPTCWVPDTENVVCPPRIVNLEPSIGGRFDLAALMSSNCNITQDAFLCINFLSFSTECAEFNLRPLLVLSTQCAVCESYNDVRGMFRDDLCALGFPGRPTMYVDGELCTVPTLARTWGFLKVQIGRAHV